LATQWLGARGVYLVLYPLPPDGQTVRYTASVGAVCSDEHGHDLLRLIVVVDAAMYAAKRAGRNRVVCL
jgi:diguanylate cyclase (GGDEF)-like protein